MRAYSARCFDLHRDIYFASTGCSTAAAPLHTGDLLRMSVDALPGVRMQGDALFLRDRRYYTSGGITAGMDLALALIQQDLGPRASLAVARELVMYLKRPVGQERYWAAAVSGHV